nr:uncharacterized protein LOC104085398 isoform X3 [Nicotiana tomentosiformis]
MYEYIKAMDEKMESHNSSLKNLKIQVSQLATLLSGKIQGPLPGNTEKNSKEHLKTIALRLGKNLDDPYPNRQGKVQEEKQEKYDPHRDKYKDDQLISDSLERCLANSGTANDDDPRIKEKAETLENGPQNEEVQNKKTN